MVLIVIVSAVILATAVFGIIFLVKVILNFKSDKKKRNTHIIRFVVSTAIFIFLGGLNTFLIIKYVYDSRAEIGKTAGSLITTAIDKTAEYTDTAMAVTSTFSKLYNSKVIKQFENLDISFLSSTFKLDGEKRIYEIEVMLDNKSKRNEEIYFESLVQKNYLIACDADDFVYKIVSEDADSGYIKDPGKSRHTILVVVPKDIEISYLQFLDRRINVK